MVDNPKRKKLSQTPFEVVETNRIPILIGAALFVFTCGFFMFKTQNNKKPMVEATHPQPKVDVNQKEDVRQWFEEDKYDNKNYSVNKIALKTEAPKTPKKSKNKELPTSKRIISSKLLMMNLQRKLRSKS